MQKKKALVFIFHAENTEAVMELHSLAVGYMQIGSLAFLATGLPGKVVRDYIRGNIGDGRSRLRYCELPLKAKLKCPPTFATSFNRTF